MDIETSVIEGQQHGRGEGDFWVDEAINDAWEPNSFTQLQQAASPCGGHIELTLMMDSKVRLMAGGELANEARVKTSIPVGYSTGDSDMMGNSVLEKTNTDMMLTSVHEDAISCTDSYDHGASSAVVVVPGGDLTFSDDIEVTFQIEDKPKTTRHCIIETEGGQYDYSYAEKLWFPWFHHMNEDNKWVAPFTYKVNDWQESSDANVLAEYEVNRTDTINTATVEEHTTWQLLIDSQEP